nr:hypothetical protein [Cytophagales bacterium]
MQEKWTLENLNLPDDRNQDHSVWLEELVLRHRKEMAIFLSYYFRREGAVVENVRMIGSAQDTAGIKGSMTVAFDVVFFNACLNINETNLDQMTLSYRLDEGKSAITLTGPYWPEREPDEI